RGLLSISGYEQSDWLAGGTLTEVPAIDRERLPAWDLVRVLVEECVRPHAHPRVQNAVPVHRHGSRALPHSVRPAATDSVPDASGPTGTLPQKASPQSVRHALPGPELSCDRSRASAWRMALARPDNRCSRWNVCRASGGHVF